MATAFFLPLRDAGRLSCRRFRQRRSYGSILSLIIRPIYQLPLSGGVSNISMGREGPGFGDLGAVSRRPAEIRNGSTPGGKAQSPREGYRAHGPSAPRNIRSRSAAARFFVAPLDVCRCATCCGAPDHALGTARRNSTSAPFPFRAISAVLEAPSDLASMLHSRCGLFRVPWRKAPRRSTRASMRFAAASRAAWAAYSPRPSADPRPADGDVGGWIGFALSRRARLASPIVVDRRVWTEGMRLPTSHRRDSEISGAVPVVRKAHYLSRPWRQFGPRGRNGKARDTLTVQVFCYVCPAESGRRWMAPSRRRRLESSALRHQSAGRANAPMVARRDILGYSWP